jgi:DNA-binding NtrC family response regulator
MSTRILVVDDEALVRKSLRAALEDASYQVDTASTAEDAVGAFIQRSPSIVILDLRLPDRDGLDLLRELRERDPRVRVIMITGDGDVRKAVSAMKEGAVDFLRKPYELDEILHVVTNAAENVERDRRLDLYEARESFSRARIIGESEGIGRLWGTVEKVASSDTTTVLILGESGTGKELFARAVHHCSARAKSPLVEVNCSSFQETLLENELFGHEKGAYTGANHLKRGLVELCDGGTLFLDEVGEMPLGTQAKLLRFIDNQTFRRVGGGTDITVDLRLVAATNAPLERLVDEGRFRKDLYYRLKVVALTLPPLRDRGDDVIALATHYVRHFSTKFKKGFETLSPEVHELFLRYPWPGNIRELKNLLERVVLLEEGCSLEIHHLPEDIQGAFPDLLARVNPRRAMRPVDAQMTLKDAADQHILRVLEACAGNRSQAARILNVSRQHLIARLKRIDSQLAEESLAARS